jgi:hypothetical protein
MLTTTAEVVVTARVIIRVLIRVTTKVIMLRLLRL